MRPIEPTAAGGQSVTFAKDQPQYVPLPAKVFNQGLVLTEWKPDEAELARLMAGEAIRLWIWRFGNQLQPLKLEVTSEDDR